MRPLAACSLGPTRGSGRGARAHDRAVHRDFIEVLGLAASHWPQRFAGLVAADDQLRRHSRVLWALGWADCDVSAQLLIDAAEAAEACDQYTRWCALKSLERLANRALPDVLTSLINDEAELLRGAAVQVAIGIRRRPGSCRTCTALRWPIARRPEHALPHGTPSKQSRSANASLERLLGRTRAARTSESTGWK